MSKTVASLDSSKVTQQSRFLNARTIPLLATLAVFVLLYAIGAVRYHDRNFFTVQVFIDFLVDNSFLGIVAIGMTLVIITGGIDLSVGGLVALCTVVMAKLMTPVFMDPLTRFLMHCHILNAANACVTMYYVAPILSWLGAIAVGLTMGFLTGCAVRYFKIEPFIATLAGLFLARGLALVLSTESIDIESGVVRGLNDVGFHLGRVQHWVPLAAALGIVAIGLLMLFVAPVGRRLLASDGAKPMLVGATLYAALFAVVLYYLCKAGFQKWGVTIGGWVSVPVVVSAIGVIVGLVILLCLPIGRKFIIAGRSKVLKTAAAWLLGIVIIALLLSHVGLNRWGVVLPSAWLSIPTVASIALVAAAVLALLALPPGRRLIAQSGAVSMLAILIAYSLVLVSVVVFLRGLVYERVLLPFPALTLLAVVVIAAYITFFTAFGRNLFAVGGNEEAAHLMGLPVGRTKMLVYMVSGLCAAIAAIVMTVYQPAGDPIGATGMELDAIAVAVIGGTLLTGGAGNVFGTFIGVLIFGIIPTGIGMEGSLSSYWARVAIGSLLLIFVVLQRFLSAGAYRKD